MKDRIVKFTIRVLCLAAAWAVIAPPLARLLIVEKPLENADAIIVLSGSSVYKERTQKAAQLYKQGTAPLVFITDDGGRAGWSQSEQTNLPFVELEQRELIANGVFPDSIIDLPCGGSGTDHEAKAVADEVDSRNIKSLLIVTSAYHSRRALWTFQKILAGKNIEIGIEHAPIVEQTPNANYWWLSFRGWQTVAGEYVKSAVYYLYY